MGKRITALLVGIFFGFICSFPVYAASVPQEDTPDYKVAFYAFDCYHMQDENGKRYGYGYDMMQSLSGYLQCTFSYVGYEKSAKECEEMLRNGEVDIYTAAKRTAEREEEFAFSKHPAITATTCMNIKIGNNDVIAGDYSTYNGLRVGLLERHTYNSSFLRFVEEKGFDCEIIYYSTPTELSDALVNGEVDALVNSYIRTPEDEMTIEDFGKTPYYIMARKEDQSLIDKLDAAIDKMNIETPNWRSNLYNLYYGSEDFNADLTAAERTLLKQLQDNHTVIRAVMNPDRNPYSWYENGQGHGIAADIFGTVAESLGLEYEIVPVSSKEEYEQLLSTGAVDICMDIDSYYEDEENFKYKITDPYLTTTLSILRRRGSSGKMNRIGVLEDNIAMKEIISATWPNAEIVYLETTQQCVEEIVDKKIDGALLMSYTAQEVARKDTQNRLSVEIVPKSTVSLKMGVNAQDNYVFYGIWKKALSEVSTDKSAELVQSYLENTDTPTLMAYLFDHPSYFVSVVVFLLITIFIICLYIQSNKTKNEQLRISRQLSEALVEARKANDAKANFFSKMSHDIRTPLNVVLGMTQVAKKYKNNPDKLEGALENITTEGNYLLTMINSILDVNQLEHGHIELLHKPFRPEECMRDSVEILQPLADKKEQKLIVTSNCREDVVTGDSGRFSQIMVNIVSNAIKYTNAGGEIKVSLEAVGENRYRFTCVDNGIGMKKEYLEHICEDYSRAEDSRISVTEGTGLGMAVVKGFTELMHGTLKIQSEPGKGSAFTVEIPFDAPTEAERKRMVNTDAEKKQLSMEFKGKRVLLAEDNPLNAEIATELLQNIGITADWAENGQTAVQKFEQSEPDTYFAVFMDMQMPVMNGIEATKQIRASERVDNDIPIFAMTANTLEKDRENCREAGMNGYISKPVNLKNIVNTLKENMNNS